MICRHCKDNPHKAKPKECKGGTWCDCAHRLPKEITKQITEGIKNESSNLQPVG